MRNTRWSNRFCGAFWLLVTAMGFTMGLPGKSLCEETQQDMAMGHDSSEDIVVVKVNGKAINMTQLMQKMADISRKKHGSEEISQLLAEKIKKEAIDSLVMEELAVQSAGSKVKSIPSERLDAKLAAVKKRFKSDDEFQSYIHNQFGDMDGFRHQMERFVTLELFIEQEFNANIEVSDTEIAKAYEELKTERFVTDEFVQVIDMTFFLDPADPKSKETIAAVTKKIVEQYNNDPRKLPMDGSFTLEKNVPLDKNSNRELYEIARKLKEYGWSDPIEINGNFHIVQLVGYKPAINQSLKEATPALKEELRVQKRQERINSWMAGLKDGAKIEIMDLTR